MFALDLNSSRIAEVPRSVFKHVQDTVTYGCEEQIARAGNSPGAALGLSLTSHYVCYFYLLCQHES